MEESGAQDYQKQLAEAQRQKQIELQKKAFMKQLLESAAYERLMNIRIGNNELYEQIVSVLLYLKQQGQLEGRLSEEKLKELASRMLSHKKRSFTIRRK
jgi:programmed cell death protein 5